jgi:hypothetical protein
LVWKTRVVDEAGTVRVARDRGGRADKWRAYRVVLDGAERARLRAGEVIELAVVPGDHELQIRIDWTGSRVHNVHVANGERADFTCSSAVRPLTALARLIQTIWNRQRWVYLEPRSA